MGRRAGGVWRTCFGVCVTLAWASVASAEEPRHHLETMVGAGFLSSGRRTHVLDPRYGYPSDDVRPEPLLGNFGGVRIGYRFRPERWFELSTTVATELYDRSLRVGAPVLFHLRLPLGDGHALSLGAGLGFDFTHGDVGDRVPLRNSCSGPFAQAEAGGVIRLSPAWSTVLTLDAQAGQGRCEQRHHDIDPGFGEDIFSVVGFSGWSGLRRAF